MNISDLKQKRDTERNCAAVYRNLGKRTDCSIPGQAKRIASFARAKDFDKEAAMYDRKLMTIRTNLAKALSLSRSLEQSLRYSDPAKARSAKEVSRLVNELLQKTY